MRETAYAKLNLALHVRRRREDGYHELETLFAFCEHGDVLSASHAERDEEQLRLEHKRWVRGTGEEPHPGARPPLGPEAGAEGWVQVPAQLFRGL